MAFGVKAAKAAEEANKVTAQTASVIKATGGAANVTVAQINRLAGSIMAKTGIDDEAIKSGQNMLLDVPQRAERDRQGQRHIQPGQHQADRYDRCDDGGNVTQEAMRKQAIQLGKALNDPIKGIGALSRVGVQFTDQQKAQITALVQLRSHAGGPEDHSR